MSALQSSMIPYPSFLYPPFSYATAFPKKIGPNALSLHTPPTEPEQTCNLPAFYRFSIKKQNFVMSIKALPATQAPPHVRAMPMAHAIACQTPKKNRTDTVHPSCFVVVILPETNQRRRDPTLLYRLQESFQAQAFRRTARKGYPFQTF